MTRPIFASLAAAIAAFWRRGLSDDDPVVLEYRTHEEKSTPVPGLRAAEQGAMHVNNRHGVLSPSASVRQEPGCAGRHAGDLTVPVCHRQWP